MPTPEPVTRLELPRSWLQRAVVGILGDSTSAFAVDLHDDHLVIRSSPIRGGVTVVPLEHVTGLRVVRELRRGLLTIETGTRAWNFALLTKAAWVSAIAFVTQVRARCNALSNGDLALAQLDAREGEVTTLLRYRAFAIYATVPLLLAAYAVREHFANAIFDLDYFGAVVRSWVMQGEVYRLVTAAWLHASWVHIVGNLVAIVWLGSAVERALGASRLVIVMTVTAITGALGSLLLTPAHSLGASGVGMGLAASFATLTLMHRGALPRPIARPLWWWLVFVLLMLPSPDGPGPVGIDHAAHAFGAFGGAGVTWLLARGRGLMRLRIPNLRWLALVAILVHVAAIAALGLRMRRADEVSEMQRLEGLARTHAIDTDEINAVAWRVAIERHVAPHTMGAALRLAEVGATLDPNDLGLADTVATLHHRTGSDARAAELEARVLDRAGIFYDASSFATQVARFLAALPTKTNGIVIESSDQHVRVRFGEDAAALAESGVTVYAVALRHGHIEGLVRLNMSPGAHERDIPLDERAREAANDFAVPIGPDIDYGTMLVRRGCGCKAGANEVMAWAADPEVLAWP